MVTIAPSTGDDLGGGAARSRDRPTAMSTSLLLGSLARPARGFARSLVRPLFDGVFAALIGGGAAYLVLMVEGGIAPLTSLASVVIQGTVAGAVGLLGAALALWYVENEEFTIVLVSLKRLLRFESDRQEALAPSAGEVLEP
jgi:hypothetical protein